MSNKVFWVDTETSGVNPNKHGIIQLAGLIEIDGQIEDTCNMEIQPNDSLKIDNEALKVNNYTHRQLKTHMDESLAFKNLFKLFNRHVDKYDSDDKLWVGGYNVNFDIDFLSDFWERNMTGQQYLGSFVNRGMCLDPYNIIPMMVDKGELTQPNSMKLKYVCKKYMDECDYNWHDAMADVKASRDLYYNLIE
jgi:DNA polymerase-3 subunit epsilon